MLTVYVMPGKRAVAYSGGKLAHRVQAICLLLPAEQRYTGEDPVQADLEMVPAFIEVIKLTQVRKSFVLLLLLISCMF